MIQDIAPYKYDSTFCNNKPSDNDYILIFEKDKVFLNKTQKTNELPTYKEVKEYLKQESSNLTYLFSIDSHKFFLYLNYETIKLDNLNTDNISVFRDLEPQWMAFAIITAYHLYNWYSSNKYCGQCGKELILSNKERALTCDTCNTTRYPQISPAIIVGITDGDRLLLTKYARGNYKRYALIAGFMEIGETLEDTVRREVMEEVGLKVKNIRYYKNQPWGLSSSMLVGFFADLDGDSDVKLDEEELCEAVWFNREDIPNNESNVSLTGEMIEFFRHQ
ncbi:MAG: NAD(+) diphosphatase [Peptostreptococcaceae bacterium]